MGKKNDDKKPSFEEAWMEGETPDAAPLSDAVVRARAVAGKDEADFVAARREMDKEDSENEKK